MKIKNIKILSILLFLSQFSIGQTTVVSDDYLVRTRKDSYTWIINGDSITPTNNKTIIHPNYPENDTIIFIDNSRKKIKIDTIISRIPKNKNYVFVIGCCDSSFDIYEESSLQIKRPNLYNDSIEFNDSIYSSSKESGLVKFIITNKPKKDSLFCLYTDFAGPPEGLLVLKNNKSQWLWPSKGYYSNSNNYIVFAHLEKDIQLWNEGDNIVSWTELYFWEAFTTLKRFGLRIFNNEKVTIIYDYKTTETQVYFNKNAP